MSNTNQILKVVSKALKSTPTGVTFFGVNNYTNQQGEVSNFVINIGASYGNAKKKDIKYLENLDVNTLETDIDKTILETARVELLKSLVTPNENRSNAQSDAYTKINDAVKIHNETNAIYIFGTRVKKTVLVEGNYSKKASNPRVLTIAKDFIRENLKTSKYRQFKIEAQPEQIKLSGASETLIVEIS